MRSFRTSRSLRVIVISLVAVAGCVGAAGAVTPPAGHQKGAERTPLADVAKTPDPQVPEKSWKVDGSGTFSDTIAIRVPSFHAITPEVSLGYDSSARHGLAGVGWTLNGASEIERTSPGGGAPAYDATDTYVLDGEHIVPCRADSVSPSCTSGGTHTTENETFKRFVLSGTGASSRWTVTEKDGTRRVYAPVLSAASDLVFRWGISQVIDTKNNVVTYHWGSNLYGCCWEYLDSITYNRTTVTFQYEQRTDTDIRAMGKGGLTTVQGRLKAIDVSVSGNRVRVYRLTYRASDATGRSLLSGVQQFGADAVTDATGTVTAGTAFPPVTATYQAGAPAFVSGNDNNAFSGNSADAKYLPMDINGDGRTDMLELWPNFGTYQRKTWISNGTDFTLASTEGANSLNQDTRYLTGDFTGDGRSDLLEISPYGLGMLRRLWVSNGTGFTAGSTGGSQGPNSASSKFLAMDINGDGRTDMLELYTCGIIPVSYCRATWLSDGTTFSLASNVAGIGNAEGEQFEPADVNGDGRTDFVALAPTVFYGGSRHIWLSTGTGFVSGATDNGINWSPPKSTGEGSRFLVMDVNDDDKADMVELYPLFGTYTRRTWISTGDGYTLGSSDTALSYAPASKQLVMDVNGDHRMDMVTLSPGFLGVSTKRDIWLSDGSGFKAGASDPTMGSYSCTQGKCTSDFLEMDVNGDMRTEMVEIYSSGIFSRGRHVWKMGGAATDVLTSRTNEWGDKVSVAYTPSSAWANVNNPPLTQNASSVTDDAGPGAAATTTYSYAGGSYNYPERTFLGFRTQTETEPCNSGETACPYVNTTFRQDLAAIGQAQRVENYAVDGTPLSSIATEFTTNGTTVPRTVLPTGTWDTTYVDKGTACPGADCRRTYTTRDYNAYGEVSKQVEYGDNEADGDERTTTTTFVPNTSAYIVNKPADVRMVVGVGADGARLTETRTSYDGASSWDQAPSAGLATTTAQWLSGKDSFVESGKEYDDYGNLTAEIDPLGARTTLGYDSTYHQFQTTETNALSQTVTASWDPGCGTATRVVDVNDQPTTVTYDALCRPVQTTWPGGKFERHSWTDLGDPSKQYEQVETPAADGSDNAHWTRRYLDGRQRSYRTVQEGPTSSSGDIYVDTAFTARGQVASTTAPYYRVAGADQPTTYPTTSTYDGLDRVVSTTAPGGKPKTMTYGLWSTTTTDENGHATTDRMDAYGKRVQTRQTVGGTARTTDYVYDLRNNLVQSTDPAGNSIRYTVDSLGRQTQVVDPDSGTTTMDWDDAGRRTAQTDGAGRRTTFTYDKLGRRTSKTTRAGTSGAATVSWTYDQVRDGFHNVGKLTGSADAAGTRSTDYDVLGHTVRTVRTIDGTSYDFRYGFDAGDRLLWTTYPDGDTQGTAASPLRYDGAGRLTAIPGYVKSVGYNAAGNVTEIDNANGTVTSRPHDAARGWLTGIKTTSGDTVVQDDTITRNAGGKITEVAGPDRDQDWTYTYDDADQLTKATNGSDGGDAADQAMTYDAAGNIARNTRTGDYTYDAAHPHAVSAAGSNTYTYDAAGNMTAGAGRVMTWNGDGLLASVAKGGVTTTFTYDADGARLQQTDGTTTRRYLGADYEVDATTNTTTKYISIAGTPVARVDGTKKYWVHTNVQGSIEAETDATGAEVHSKQYRPFGEVLSTGGALPFEARGFTAERQDATGLVYLNARYYDPQLGRFISPDPTIDGDAPSGLNRYSYAANDPVNNTDHTGLSCQGSQSDHCKPGDPITRSDIIARAQYWVKNPPPNGYDQSSSFQDADGKQYRTDCSGYVSMAWHLTGSPGTDTIANPASGIATMIDRDQLLPGDVLDDTLSPGESSENHHIILFNGYTDASKTEFNYFSFGGGALPEAGRAFTDPARSPKIAGHLNSNYRAFRYNNVLDDPPAGQGPAAGQNGAGAGLAPSAVQNPGATPDPAVPAPFN